MPSSCQASKKGLAAQDWKQGSSVLSLLRRGIVLRSASIARQCLDSDFGGTKSFTSTQGFDRTNIPAA